jgi:hypothetical protein
VPVLGKGDDRYGRGHWSANRSQRRAECALVTCALALAACRGDRGPAFQIVGESARLRSDDPLPRESPYFDGRRVALVAARGETLGIEVWHRDGGPVALELPGARVAGYATVAYAAVRPSTAMYGGSHGAGSYPDGLVAATAPATDPAYFEIAADASANGELVVGARHIPVELTIAPVALPPLPLSVWAYYDAHELGGTNTQPSAAERACIAMFRAHGVLLSPDLPPDAWPARRELLAGAPFVPAVVGDAPGEVHGAVRAWIDRTAGTGQVPFAIPIDEPHTVAARANVRLLGDAAHDAGAGPGRFLFAVTDDPHVEYGNAVDLVITLHPRLGDRFARWTYNGAPPHAGSMVLDAEAPGLRTWGWIAWRWQIPIWYAWDALYWHDRHNGKRALDAARDATSFEAGDDHGNLDGVLALPAPGGCLPTLRLAALRRGLEDRALLELAASCAPDETAALAAHLVPRALGDASDGSAPSWPHDEATWEAARRQLLDLAARCPH